nr:galactokinase [Lachnospiraceae bacterium]
VFPCALTIGTYAVVRRNGMDTCRFYSMNFENLGIISADIEELEYDKENDWANYPMGVIYHLREEGFTVDEGMDFLFFGNIPNSSGLSSSASIEVVTAFATRELFDLNINFVEIAKLTQKAENKFIGVNCGIMDQFAIAMGKKDNAIFLDTADLSYEYAPIVLKGAKIVIACSNKKRGLGDSKYNERRQECEDALALIKTRKDVPSLGALSEEEFEDLKDVINDEVKIRRAKHAVYENRRTIKAVEALKNNDIETFGKLMNASHVSLRDDYEVTGIELDTLVETAWTVPGVIGSRMTGAGFGGCTVSIVREDCTDNFIKVVGDAYKQKIGYAADFYVVEVGDGPVEINE